MKSILLLVVLVVTLTACSKEVTHAVPPAQPALTQIVGKTALSVPPVYSGEIRARHELFRSFRLGGKMVARPVELGDRVKSGQILARLDPLDAGMQAGAAQAKYQLAVAEAMRFRDLRKQGFVSQSALDGKEAALKVAVAQAGLTHNQAEYTILRAAHDGVVVATLAEVGQVVSAGQPVLQLAQAGELDVAIAIPEAQLADYHLGDRAQIQVLANKGAALLGRLRELSPAADPFSRTYAARVAIQAAPRQLALGMTARVRFNKQHGSGEFLIPLTAIYQQGKQIAVWIVSADQHVSLRQVKIKAYHDTGAVVESGLTRGERIVSAGVHRLSPGEIIQPLDAMGDRVK
ncbi:MAG: efflux RND transporter periplasmic adaptor subunit [Gallionella sp.]